MRRLILTLTLALCQLPALAAAEESEPKWDVNALPGEARRIDIDVTRGTWMSLDVSPDGKSIAFDLLGDIYLLPIAGGDARPLHSGLSWSMQPRFSPDGAQIAFISDAGGGDNVWLMGADGSEARQLTQEDFRLLNNPGGRRTVPIAARKHFTTERSPGTGEIWLRHRGGGAAWRWSSAPTKHQKESANLPSPDGATSTSARQHAGPPSNTPGFQRPDFRNPPPRLKTGKTEPLRPARRRGAPHALARRQVAGLRAPRAQPEHAVPEGPDPLNADLHGTDQTCRKSGQCTAYPNMDWRPTRRVSCSGRRRHPAHRRRRRRGQRLPACGTAARYCAAAPAVEVAPAEFDTHMARNAEVAPDGSAIVFETAGRLYVRALPDGAAAPDPR
jgi:dipeptidyl aminopeptidase/acylaminoacyl peptidase